MAVESSYCCKHLQRAVPTLLISGPLFFVVQTLRNRPCCGRHGSQETVCQAGPPYLFWRFWAFPAFSDDIQTALVSYSLDG
jgi:hypothetical protein